MNFERIVNQLKEKGIQFDEGLSDIEVEKIQNCFDICFPPDLKELLQYSLPVSNHFVNWRNMNENNIEAIRERIGWPLEGMLFDIEHNSFWYDSWGKRPEDLSEAFKICKNELAKVPTLIPICSHRYIPSEPCEGGNPVFSVYQTDIIYYGENLKSYLEIEFGIKKYCDMDFDSIRKVRFWSDLLE